MRNLIFSVILSMSISGCFAQVDLNYWDQVAYAHLGGGMVFPGNEMKSTHSSGLFAKNGFQLYGDLNVMIKYGIGIGVNIEHDEFIFNKSAFLSSVQPESMDVKGNYTSTKYGLNILMNIPTVVTKNKFTVNFYGQLTPGLKNFNVPDIDLYYDENLNKYVEVHYRTRKNIMGFIGYSCGLQTLFSDKWGINLSYNGVLKARHSINYSVRRFDAFGNLYEDEKYMTNYLNHSGWQLGVMFLIGKE